MHGDSFDRRRLLTGLCAVVGGSLVARSARAFPRGAANDFRAASRILDAYGVTVGGETSGGHDVLDFDIVPIAATEYRQSVGVRNAAGGLDPSVETSVFEDDARFTHFHPGEVNPCWRGTIEGHARAITEVFDPDQGGINPCWREIAEMLEGGHIGTITATHFHPADTGGVDPCWRGTIVGHSRAVTELFDADQGGVEPCWRESAEMLEGGHIGTITATHFHPADSGGVQPCWRGTIEGHARAITELFDSDQGGINPCWREVAEMLEGGHIGTITATHFHPTRTGEVSPCWRTTIEGHSRGTLEVFNAGWGAPPDPDMPSLALSAEMLGAAVIGAVRVTVNQLDQDLEIHVGARVYRLQDGALVEQAR